jgi:hypothetical protein
MVVSNIGLVELIEAAGEGLHIPEGKTKGFSVWEGFVKYDATLLMG